MTTETPLPVRVGDDVVDRLHHSPIIDVIDRRTLALIKAQIAPRCTDAEVGHFLELCAHYQLDPFAHEAWIAKGRGDDGRLLIMVGRDGLRKIAERNNRDVQCDVVREKDEYSAEFIGNKFDAKEGEWEAHGGAPFHRIIHKRQGMGTARGPILGAWCVVTDGATAREKGWFEAPMEEYRPTNEKQLKYSPWGSQESVMILAAAERQALRQATPLSGLLAVGEDARIAREDISEGEGVDQPQGLELSPAIEEIIAKAEELRHPGLANRTTWETQIGRPEADLQELIREAQVELENLAAQRAAEPPESPEPPEASVVDDDRELPIDDDDLPSPKAPTAADQIECYDVPEKNERWYSHPGCDGVGARWVEPLDDAPLPMETECAQCMSVYPVVAVDAPLTARVEAPLDEPAEDLPSGTSEPEQSSGTVAPDGEDLGGSPPIVADAPTTDDQTEGSQGTAVQKAKQEALARLRARKRLYEGLEPDGPDEEADRDRELNELDQKIVALEAEGVEVDDDSDQGSLL